MNQSHGMKLYGLFGDPVEHSLSPLMHNTWFKRLNIEGVYLPFRIPSHHLGKAVEALSLLNMRGVNITVPHKTAVVSFLDRLEGDALVTGSVNTIVNQEGELIGYSTDGVGLLRSLKEEAKWEPGGNSVAILGTGGASTAIAFRMAIEGVSQLTMVGRSDLKLRAIAGEIREKVGLFPQTVRFDSPYLRDIVAKVDLLINTTPLGMAPEIHTMPPVPPEWTHEKAIFCDLVYNPRQTLWLKEAHRIGRQTLSGLGMLIYQGAEAFRLWHGVKPPVEDIKALLESHLKREN